jgi:anaerobic selenocysteine-containing dehydrogenase
MNRRVREPGGFQIPLGARHREFETPGRRARFTVHPLPHIEVGPGRLLMMTIRSHDQFNTTVYGEEDRYRGVSGSRHVVFLHPDDLAGLGLREGARVDITSHWDGTTRCLRGFRAVAYDIPRGCAATYFPEANPLVPVEHAARGSNTPAYKSVVISLAPSSV